MHRKRVFALAQSAYRFNIYAKIVEKCALGLEGGWSQFAWAVKRCETLLADHRSGP
jgi:hypothetical protein